MFAHIRHATATMAMLSVAGCAAVPVSTSTGVTKVDGLGFMVRSPETDLVTVSAPDNPVKYCLSAETDALPTMSGSLGLTFGSEQAKIDDAIGVGELGGRSPGVLISRDLLYRTCEFLSNHRLSDEQATALFKTTMDHVEEVAKADSGQAGTSPTELAQPGS